MNVYLASAPGETAARVPGPADLHHSGLGAVLVLTGTPNRDSDFGRWAGAIGAAALRGANVRWQ